MPSFPAGHTLLDIVRYRAGAESGFASAPAFTYLDDGEHVGGGLTYAELDARARGLAAHLQTVARPGDRVLLVYPPSLDYIIAFYACTYAGMIAVPTVSANNSRTLPRLLLMAADAAPSVALTQSGMLARLSSLSHGALGATRWIATDTLLDLDPAAWQPPATQADDIVFLQYTSGSTGAPKGVMVSHANLLANAEHCRVTYGMAAHDVFVSWLPPHHDFGLIGTIVLPAYVGTHSVQFPPTSFLVRPFRWLELITRYGARHTGAPNFAYELCVQRVSEEEKRQLDLSSLAVTVNGAERIRPETMRRFAAAFASCGLAPHSMTPSYGIAESVLLASANVATPVGETPQTRWVAKRALSAGLVAAGDAGGRDVVEVVRTGSARSAGGHRAIVVDPETLAELPEERVGEVWLQGPSVARGYWNRPEESEATFRAALAGEAPGWLRTGDLGFISAGALYITGRRKEVMIFNGRNVYPQDVEVTVEGMDPAFRANGCAVFALEDDAVASLVIVQELERGRRPALDGLIASIRAELAEQHELFDLAALLLVRAGNIPRTSSGKIQRGRCRELFEAGAIEPVWAWRSSDATGGGAVRAPETETERIVLAAWQAAFDRSEISTTDSFFELGGNSLLAAELVAKLRAAFEVELPLDELFHAPTIAALARKIETARARTAPALPPIARRPPAGRLPLSFAQQRFWFLDQIDPGNPFYGIPLAVSLTSPVDVDALQAALNALTERHAALRSVFEAGDGEPVQVVLPSAGVVLRIVDLRDLAPDDTARRVAEEIAAEADRPFDLARGPLMRAALVRQAAGEGVLLLSFHHIVFDGGSVVPLFTELATLYAAARTGKAALPPLAFDYRDYARWENEHYRGAWLEGRIAWWRDTLAGAPPLLALPTDRPRAPGLNRRGAAVPLTLPRGLVQGLTALGRRHNATLFMVLTAAMNAVLHRSSGQSDFCVGLMSANRPPGTESLVGNFVNVVPLRARLSGDTPFPTLLAETAGALLAAYEHQLPFELILQHATKARDLSYTPYVQVVLNFHNELEHDEAMLRWQGDEGLQIAGRHPSSIRHAAFDLKVEVQDRAGDLEMSFEYSTELFDGATVERLAEHLRVLLEGIVATPGARVCELPLLSAAERHRLVVEWNQPSADLASVDAPALAGVGVPEFAEAGALALAEVGVHALVSAQAARTPDAPAVVCGAEQLSYGELNARANQLAHHLRGLGVRPDMVVGLCVERGVGLVVGLLGILKAGGAYLPLDPEHPAARLELMLAETGAPLVVTQESLRSRLPGHVRSVALDADWAAVAQHAQVDPVEVTSPQSLAYCIYTSGSTGQPKGAVNTHQGFTNLVRWYAGVLGVGEGARVMLASSLSFDLTQKNIPGPLICGGTLIVPPGAVTDVESFQASLERDRPTLINCAPSALRAYRSGLSGYGSLRTVVLGGEPIDVGLANALADAGITVLNSYGPTECADVAIAHVQPPVATRAVLPLGRPLPNVQIYLLDRERNPVPIGVAGEIHIAGIGVSRGYVNRPDLTAERFLPNPFGTPGSRMYATGDLGRYLADGTIEFLGRADHQVKLRGFRIELGEIESTLLRCEGVREAAVLLREEGEPRLVGYVVGSATPAQLRAYLLVSLPAYMVPGTWVALDVLPKTSSGKIDRRALPAPGAVETASAYVAPRDERERALARIWAEVLGVERVGVEDDFFELGGHSLLAMQLVSRVRRELGVELPLRAFFDAPTVGLLAAQLARHAATPAVAVPAIRRLPRRNSVPQAQAAVPPAPPHRGDSPAREGSARP